MNTIKTNERIFRVENFEFDIQLCNLDRLSINNKGLLMIDNNEVKSIKHYWNNEFQSISKLDVKEMIKATNK